MSVKNNRVYWIVINVIIYTHNYKNVLFFQFVLNGRLKFWSREEEPLALIFSIIV